VDKSRIGIYPPRTDNTPVAATTVCKQITPEDGRGLRPKHVEL